MKKYIITFVAGFLFLRAAACDICGNGVNNLNPYLFPHLSKSHIGISYLHSHYLLTEDGSLRDQYNRSVVFTGQHTLKNRIQLMVLVPFQSNSIKTGESLQASSGLGDLTLLANYTAMKKTTGSINHALSFGGGIKLPTGKYNLKEIEGQNDQNFQLGTGSTDYLASLVYRVNIGSFSINTLGTYKYTSANNSGFRYGDVLTTSATGAYLLRTGNFMLAPYVQLLHELHYRDAAKHILQDHSGGAVLYTGGGLDVSTQKITLGINYQVATRQNLLHGELKAQPRLSARISFSLSSLEN